MKLGKGDDELGTVQDKRHETMRALVALSVLVIAFVAMFILFVQSPLPFGSVPDFYPSGNFTGTTTITTSYGYVCVASHIPGAENYAASSTTTLPGIGMQCSPELFGSLQVPVGPEIFVVWLIAFAVAFGTLAFYFHRKAMQKSS